MHAAKKEEKFMRCRSGKVVCGQELGPWPAWPLPHLASTGQGGQVPGLGPAYHTGRPPDCSPPSLPTNGDAL